MMFSLLMRTSEQNAISEMTSRARSPSTEEMMVRP